MSNGIHRRAVLAGLMALALCAASTGGQRWAQASERLPGRPANEVAHEVDTSLSVELPDQAASPHATKISNDETFLRRISQDLVGELPSPEQITAFVLDPAADKRAKMVDRLLADPRFGQNWARYFRDVILYRKTDERAGLSGPAIVEFLTRELNQNAGWDKIARSFIVATGDVRDNGNTGLIMAQMGQSAEIAAETARIFLGVQIQCAQCHDHKTDRWKREQFHELAAFFPRIAIRPVREEPSPQDKDKNKAKRISFEVVSRDINPRRPPKDGKFKGAAEHLMPDLNDPSAKGTVMQPVFFLTGQKLPLGTKDSDRRQALADWITSPQDPWFARAFVNRVWAELVGQGFYEPIDDLGPDRVANAPHTLELLCNEFIRHNYDVKWLLRTIAATQTYQHESRSQRAEATAPFVANCPQPLRADQVFNALATALGFDEASVLPPGGGPQRYLRGPRAEFDKTFGYDPSMPREEVSSSIPQALLMMNSPLLARAISAKSPGTLLEKLVAQKADDETIVTELYLRCLAREPRPEELAACQAYVRSSGQRVEALEDVLWALLNSTEFTHRK